MQRSSAPNLAKFDLVSLRLAHLCAEHGSLGRAAEAAHLSISGASHRLKALENALGDTLFIRHRRGLQPTDAGHQVVTTAIQMLCLVEELQLSLAKRKANSRAYQSDPQSPKRMNPMATNH